MTFHALPHWSIKSMSCVVVIFPFNCASNVPVCWAGASPRPSWLGKNRFCDSHSSLCFSVLLTHKIIQLLERLYTQKGFCNQKNLHHTNLSTNNHHVLSLFTCPYLILLTFIGWGHQNLTSPSPQGHQLVKPFLRQ